MAVPRVVVISHTAQLGGGEIAMLRLLRGIPADQFEVRALLFENGPLRAQLRNAGIESDVVPLGALNEVSRNAGVGNTLRIVAGSAAFAPRLIATLRRLRPQLLVANSLKSALLTGVVAPVVRVPWVWHLHDRLSPDYLPALTATALRTIARRGPRHVVVNSTATGQTLGKVTEGHVSVAYPGLDRQSFTGARGESTHQVIGMVGRISATKGQLEFIEAASMLLDRYHNTRFSIIGRALFQDGDYERLVRERVGSSPLAARLDFAGWTDDPGAAMRSLQIFVHASPVAEPFGQVIVEAMALGVPVIATAAGGVIEILDPSDLTREVAEGVRVSDFGILVTPADPAALARAMSWALDHPEEVTAMAVRATDSARARFTLERSRAIVLGAWASSLSRRRRHTNVIR